MGAERCDQALANRLRDLHRRLEATAERPLETEVNRWLGEAGAVASDLAAGNPSPPVARERVATVLELLEEVEETGDPIADDHVGAARRVAREILAGESA